MIIAVDFDGTLQLPDGQANAPLMHALRLKQRSGDILILWTCRNGTRLAEAVAFCLKNGLRFNFVNQNPPQVLKMLGYDPRKIYADLYIDDKAQGFR